MPDDKAHRTLREHLKLVIPISGRLLAQMESLRTAFEPLDKLVREHDASIAAIVDSITARSQRVQRVLTARWEPLPTLSDNTVIPSQVAALERRIQEHLDTVLLPLRNGFEALPGKVESALLALGNRAWWFDLNMSFSTLGRLKRDIAADATAQVDEHLAGYFDDRLSLIESELTARHPHRSHIVSAAFAAHRNGEYVLSIPALFAQVDGICFDTAGQCFFLKNSNAPEISIYVKEFAADKLRAAILSPLKASLPISYSRHKRPAGFNELNRHMVLHGESLDYGTRVNSLKVISLLNYVSQVLAEDYP